MAGSYTVLITGAQELHGPFGLVRAKAFARIGSQHGKHRREVWRGMPGRARSVLVRRYVRGKRTWPRTRAEGARAGLRASELPRTEVRNPRGSYVRVRVGRGWDLSVRAVGYEAVQRVVEGLGLTAEELRQLEDRRKVTVQS